MTPVLEKEGPVAYTSSNPAPEMSKYKLKGPQKKHKGPNSHQGKGKCKGNWHRPYPQRYRIPKLEPSAVYIAFKMARTLQLGKFDSKLTKITSDINALKKNNRASSEFNKSPINRLDLISNECDRIERRYQVQIDEIEDLSISKINDKLKVLKNHVIQIIDNTTLFSTHLARSDSERQKSKYEILAHVEQIHKNYEPNSYIPRHSTPLAEEKYSVKGGLTPSLGENGISEKDIPKLEEWPTFSGEG
ncbi:hypothetical protein O181_031510 [Austropuccinia psidii MF-1]|uniref:Uncharacterized protein n=1 Tax=Austropuccinia psidii MF-1 TaxID=1389203 RepID=A0A9Q3CZ79_9BASI|nr:hypothetical protein [Austropuccinia psidii MF-1]